MRVTYSPRAALDLVDIADYVFSRSRMGAVSIERAIHRSVNLLADFPESGRVLEQRPSIRVMPLGRYPYLIFYTTDGDELIVLHVRHASRSPVDPLKL